MTEPPAPPDRPDAAADPGPSSAPLGGAPWSPGLPASPPPAPPAGVAPPPIPASYAPAPIGARRGWRNRRLVILLAVIALLVIAGVVGAVVASHNSRFTIVSSSSTDGTFSAGDCVSLSATRVTKRDCTGAHDAQIIQVIHGNQTCPSRTEEFDVNDGTGNLCLDRGNHSKG
jgi:hypothetical protein